ncbi:hypothetical protein ACT17Q_04155 [Cellulomonas sp. CW35]|uniref:hypothetical protein n=1 Tax=Cellulomonas sp. CW35 TaxID=3458249 RepID=UPI004034EE05
MSTSLAEQFAQILRGEGRRSSWSPAAFLEAWSQFVEECELSYSSGIYEYEDERSVRDVMERLVTWPFDNPPVGLEDFKAAMAATDDRFRRLIRGGPIIRPQAAFWWQSHLPPFGGEQLVEDAKRLYDVDLELE